MVTLETLTLIRAPIERCFDLARNVEVHLAGNVHCGEAAVALAGVTSGLIGLGQRVTWRAKHFGVRQSLNSEITAMDRPTYFPDTMLHGAFRFMHHDQFLRPLSRDVCRATRANRRSILESRTVSTRLLNEAIASLNRAPRLWINASTATIYRHALDRPMSEADGELGGNEPGAPDTWNFSIDVAKAWEEAFFSTALPLTRKVAIRSAMTFSPDRGGVFDVFLGLVRYGVGGRQGPGTQFVSWIHEADFALAVDLLIAREDFSG